MADLRKIAYEEGADPEEFRRFAVGAAMMFQVSAWEAEIGEWPFDKVQSLLTWWRLNGHSLRERIEADRRARAKAAGGEEAYLQAEAERKAAEERKVREAERDAERKRLEKIQETEEEIRRLAELRESLGPQVKGTGRRFDLGV